MPPLTLVVHGHFYQPPRENPWTEEVDREPSAAPFHDWNARIAAESYRPNAYARVLDERNRVVAIVNNYEHLSFDVGPTLASWLEHNEPDAYRRVLEADAVGGGGMAQAFFHVILPLARKREVRTQVRWGMAEFRHRFGRRPEGIWLPETGVNDAVLSVLAEEGVGFTVLAPDQARRWRAAGETRWTDAGGGRIDTRRPYRWRHPTRPDLGVDLVFYDGGLSHSVAFGLGSLSSQALLDRVAAAAGAGGGLVTVAADGETFGHHHHYGDRLLSYALAVEAPRRGLPTTNLARYLREHRPRHEVAVHESAWSCAHGVGRWKADCGCSTGGEPGWDQRWRAPLRAALDVVAGAVDEVFDRRGPLVLADHRAALDDYVSVLIGATDRAGFAARHVTGDRVAAFTLLEAERHRMAMFTSCGWFFNDLAGLETVQVLRYAARAMDCLSELGEPPPVDAFLAVLAQARSNLPGRPDGRAVWVDQVDPARVDAGRAVAHLVLVALLGDGGAPGRVGIYDTDLADHGHASRSDGTTLCTGRVVVTHGRTGRRTGHVYGAVHRGGLEVDGATREADPGRDGDDLAELWQAFHRGEAPDELGHRSARLFGPRRFDLASALPDGPAQLLHGAARALTDRLASEYDRLFADHLPTLVKVAATGHALPAELQRPAALALGRRLEQEVARLGAPLDPDRYAGAVALADQARAMDLDLDVPAARATIDRLVLAAVQEAVRGPDEAVPAALAALELAGRLAVGLSLDRPQEIVYEAVRAGRDGDLAELGEALGLAVDMLGRPG